MSYTDRTVTRAELTLRETKFLTDELRRQAAITLPEDISVLSREQIISLASAQNDSAETDVCKLLKSDYEKFSRPNRMEYEYNPAMYDIPYGEKFKKVRDAKGKREASLIASGVFLLSGVMVHVWF